MTEIDVDELIHELRELKLRVARLEREHKTDTESPAPNKSVLAVGDRVKIKNRVRKPQNWPTEKDWTESKERTATVTKVTPKQIHYITDNGTQTWRAPHNLRKTT